MGHNAMVDNGELLAGVRTVTNLAAYLEELKAAATQLAGRVGAGRRGYFTPSEEEQVLGLLVSYRQTRSALLELIASLRAGVSSAPPAPPEAFLVAFAAALLLVDAARFLRQLVAGRPVLRRKLNEPAPSFGIPGGTYDSVQKSLVSPRHAWHLYHAWHYFEQQQASLRSLAEGGPLEPLVPLVDRLLPRLDVPLAAFARTRLRTRVDQLARHVGRQTVMRAIYGLQKLGSSLISGVYVRPGHCPRLAEDAAASARQLLRPGDVLVTRKDYVLTNYFLPGYWPHAALYLGRLDDLVQLQIAAHPHIASRWHELARNAGHEPQLVLESLKDGVRIRTLGSPLACDALVVLRPRLPQPLLGQALARAMAHEGKPYDFDFNFARSDRLVCTEVVYRAYDGMGGIGFTLVQRAGRPTFAGRDLVRLGLEGDAFEPLAVAAPRLAAGLVTGDQVPAIIRQAESDPET